jgi:hypothetical protein
MTDEKIDLDNIDNFIDEYTEFCIERSQEAWEMKNNIIEIFELRDEIIEKKKELLEMIKKFKEVGE